MRNFPISLLNTFCPTPKTALPHSCRFVLPKLLVEIEAVTSDLIDHKSHFVLITRSRLVPVDLRRQVHRCNLRLTHGHMAHLWTIKVNAVADCKHSLLTGNAHRPVDIYVAVVVCDSHV